MILSIKNLNIAFGNNKKIIEDFNCKLNAGKITAIVGESGSGKSSIALAILNLHQHINKNIKVFGEIIFNDCNLLKLSIKELTKIRGKEISLIFQDSNSALNPLHKIHHQIAEAILIHNPKISKINLNLRIEELLKIVELKEFIFRKNCYPHQLSGGQKQRVMIAIALANNPKILIADEPTTALDNRVQNEILNLLKKLANNFNLSILLITHNRNIVAKLADEIIEIGNKISPNLNQFYPKKINHNNQEKIIEIENLTVSNKKNFLNNNLTFNVKNGLNLGIIGESGSGKTTLALALCNLLRNDLPLNGEIKYFGNKIWKKNNQELRKLVQIIFQDPFASLNPRMLVNDIVKEGLIIQNYPKNIIQKQVDEIFEKLHLSKDLQNRYPHQLSGGQRQRISIGRALIVKPKILILDEPTSSLDHVVECEILNLLKEIQIHNEITYIIISHNLEVIESIADEVGIISNGKIIDFGEVNLLLKKYQNIA
jgi:ABC-type microcin C transport system duplicated ATPase subunit YejF